LEDAPYHRGGHRRDEPYSGPARLEPARRTERIEPEPLDLGKAATGKQRDDRYRALDPELAPGVWLIDVERNLVGERMADEDGPYAVAPVELRLEGQQAEHEVARPRDELHAVLAPRPHLRTDELHGRQSRAAQLRGEAEIERGCVDADEHVRPLAFEAFLQASAKQGEPRQLLQRLEQPHHGKLVCLRPGLAALGRHARARDACGTQPRHARAQ